MGGASYYIGMYRRNEELDDKVVIAKLRQRVLQLEKELVLARQHTVCYGIGPVTIALHRIPHRLMQGVWLMKGAWLLYHLLLVIRNFVIKFYTISCIRR